MTDIVRIPIPASCAVPDCEHPVWALRRSRPGRWVGVCDSHIGDNSLAITTEDRRRGYCTVPLYLAEPDEPSDGQRQPWPA